MGQVPIESVLALMTIVDVVPIDVAALASASVWI
jgi:hypothetical protein